jgi:hypothetical protein
MGFDIHQFVQFAAPFSKIIGISHPAKESPIFSIGRLGSSPINSLYSLQLQKQKEPVLVFSAKSKKKDNFSLVALAGDCYFCHSHLVRRLLSLSSSFFRFIFLVVFPVCRHKIQYIPSYYAAFRGYHPR